MIIWSLYSHLHQFWLFTSLFSTPGLCISCFTLHSLRHCCMFGQKRTNEKREKGFGVWQCGVSGVSSLMAWSKERTGNLQVPLKKIKRSKLKTERKNLKIRNKNPTWSACFQIKLPWCILNELTDLMNTCINSISLFKSYFISVFYKPADSLKFWKCWRWRAMKKGFM